MESRAVCGCLRIRLAWRSASHWIPQVQAKIQIGLTYWPSTGPAHVWSEGRAHFISRLETAKIMRKLYNYQKIPKRTTSNGPFSCNDHVCDFVVDAFWDAGTLFDSDSCFRSF